MTPAITIAPIADRIPLFTITFAICANPLKCHFKCAARIPMRWPDRLATTKNGGMRFNSWSKLALIVPIVNSGRMCPGRRYTVPTVGSLPEIACVPKSLSCVRMILCSACDRRISRTSSPPYSRAPLTSSISQPTPRRNSTISGWMFSSVRNVAPRSFTRRPVLRSLRRSSGSRPRRAQPRLPVQRIRADMHS